MYKRNINNKVLKFSKIYTQNAGFQAYKKGGHLTALEPLVRLELATYALRMRRSTN